ncbi:MATE family efflux transporter [Succinivibrio sp.]|uniref:MATE family efflux transporter n=1 Tax=Succinivibrio sp. TaxID=2053619 RepID=UPI0025F5A6DC|nr:MATE family efflux transporter [Succinivibrio sp.]MBQ9219871.1 MATE family efflux transporter [Succinivibrio sp.]
MHSDILTRGNIYRSILLYAIPIIIGNSVQQLYNFCDMLIVGRIIGLDALAACGATGPIFFLVFGFIFATTQGFTIVTAQKFGEKNFELIKKSYAISTILSVVIAVGITCLILPLSYHILRLLHTPEELIEQAHTYMYIIVAGTLPLILYNLLSCIMRALGDSKTPLYFLIISSALNLCLDLIFIVFFKLGIAGAAYATLVAWTVSDILCYIYIHRRFPELRLTLQDFRFSTDFLYRHIRIGIPMGLQLCVISLCTLVLQSGINRLGSNAVAAFTTAIIVDQLFSQLYIALGSVISVFTAQNYGAGNYKRIADGVKKGLTLNVGITMLLAVLILLFSKPLIEVFIENNKIAIIKLAQETLYVYVCFYIFFGMIMVLKNTLLGLGLARYPLISSFFELGLRFFIIDILLEKFGYIGVCAIMPIGWIVGFSIMFTAYIYEKKRLAI